MQAKVEMVKFNNKMKGAVKIKSGPSKDGKLKRKLKPKDPKAPKRPRTAYLEFLGKERQKVWMEMKSVKGENQLPGRGEGDGKEVEESFRGGKGTLYCNCY